MSKNDVAYVTICDCLNDIVDRDKKVLELACGTGQITFRMADKAAIWIATDYSENMVKEAEKRNLSRAEKTESCLRLPLYMRVDTQNRLYG